MNQMRCVNVKTILFVKIESLKNGSYFDSALTKYSSNWMFTEILRGHELFAPHVYELTHLQSVRTNSVQGGSLG